MSNDRLLPAVIAASLGAVLALVLLVPYVAVQYRRRGALGPGRVALALVTLVYVLALVAYVLLPLPQIGPGFCQLHGVDPQLRPFQFVGDIVREGAASLAALGRNPAVLGVAFNIMLFVPFGALFRHLTNRSISTTMLAGAAVSLLVELTQLTGVWFLFPCAYRLFDIDDLITNTVGTLIGATVVAPMLRALPGQDTARQAETPQPVTTSRRLLGMLCDVLAVMLTASALHMLVRFVLSSAEPGNLLVSTAWLIPAIGQFALIWCTGASLGEHSVRVCPTAPIKDITARAKLIRWTLGIGGYNLLIIPDNGITSMLAFLLAAVSVVAAWFTRCHRGLAYLAAGLDLTDARVQRGPKGALQTSAWCWVFTPPVLVGV